MRKKLNKLHGLTIAPHKTKVVIMKGPRKRDFELEIMDKTIQHKRELKYLGVILDHMLLFGQHVKYAVKKAQNNLSPPKR